MTIFYLGNFLPSHSTETHISKTLRNMGHTVVELQENFIQSEHLYSRMGIEDFDLFLFTRTWGETLKNDHLDILRKRGIPSASFHLDLYVGLQRDGNMGSDPFWRTDYVFSTDGDEKSAQIFKKQGINHVYIKPGVFEEECYLLDLTREKDVIFVGSYGYHPEYPYRQQLIDWLRNTYRERFELWGPDGLGHIRGDELNNLYARTKVVVGDSLMLPGHTHYWSDRVYETMGRGGFLIHPYIKGMKEEFHDAIHLRYYEHGNFNQLRYLVDHYIKNETEREKIRETGHKFVKENCTYTQRMAQILEVVRRD